MSISPAIDQGFAIHFSNMKDLVCYMNNPQNENRVSELVAVLCQICQRSDLLLFLVCVDVVAGSTWSNATMDHRNIYTCPEVEIVEHCLSLSQP